MLKQNGDGRILEASFEHRRGFRSNYVRIVLQHIQSGWFYQGQGTWTPDLAVAFDFQFSAGKPEFCEKLELRDARLVVQRDPGDTFCIVQDGAPQP